MEKVITIDGIQVKFKSNGSTPKRFKAQFNKDFFGAMVQMSALKGLNTENVDLDTLNKIDFDVLSDICWALAKTADKNIPDPIEWLDQFDTFPLFDIIEDLQDLIVESLTTNRAKKK